MAEKKEKKNAEGMPECIEKYKKLKDSAKEIIDTIDNSHRAAWLYAEKEVLMEDGRIKMDKLKDLDTRLKFGDKIADHYDTAVENYFGLKGKKFDEAEKELLRNAYAGTTRSMIRSDIAKLGKRFDFDHFYKKFAQGESMQLIKHNLISASYNHFTTDHIDDILKYTKSEHLFDLNALKEKPDVAHNILTQFEEVGAITSKYVDAIKENPDMKYFLKKEVAQSGKKKEAKSKKAA